MKLIPVEMEVDRYHLSYFKKVFEVAKEKFILWKKRDKQYKLREFISYCLRYEPEQSEGLSLEYYTDNGGYVTKGVNWGQTSKAELSMLSTFFLSSLCLTICFFTRILAYDYERYKLLHLWLSAVCISFFLLIYLALLQIPLLLHLIPSPQLYYPLTSSVGVIHC
jgi:hypothetical protein